ncbi:glycoside hydrolase family 19 protein [Aeromonas hydrophila]
MKDYAPYIGRGMLQLTHRSNYKFYDAYSNKGILSDINMVSNSLAISFDSAGWFWRRGKVLSTSDTWRPSSSDSIVSRYSSVILIKKS